MVWCNTRGSWEALRAMDSPNALDVEMPVLLVAGCASESLEWLQLVCRVRQARLEVLGEERESWFKARTLKMGARRLSWLAPLIAGGSARD